MGRGRRTAVGAAPVVLDAGLLVDQVLARADERLADRTLDGLRGELGLPTLGMPGQTRAQMAAAVEEALASERRTILELAEDPSRLERLADMAASTPATECLIEPLLRAAAGQQRLLAAALLEAAPTPRSEEAKKLLAVMDLERAAGARVASRAAGRQTRASALERELKDLGLAIETRANRARGDLFGVDEIREEEMTDALRAILLGPRPLDAGAALGAWWRALGDEELALLAEGADPDNYRRAVRVEQAYAPKERDELVLSPLGDYPLLDQSRLDELMADRLAGDRGERALARRRRRWAGMQNLRTCDGAEEAGRLAARMLRRPEDYALTGDLTIPTEPKDRELVVPVSARALAELVERFGDRKGASLVVRVVPDRGGNGPALASPALRLVSLDPEGRTVAVNLTCPSRHTKATTQTGLLAAAELAEFGLEGREVKALVEHAAPGPRCAYAPRHPGETPEPGLLEALIPRERCAHPNGKWAPSADGGAIRLECARCDRQALAVVPRYRLSAAQERQLDLPPLDSSEQLAQARRYAILAGAPLAQSATLASLCRDEGAIETLDPARFALDTRPSAPPASRRASLGQVLGGRRSGFSR